MPIMYGGAGRILIDIEGGDIWGEVLMVLQEQMILL